MSHLTTRDRTVSPDGYAAALRILRRLLAGIERPPALRLGDMLLHELESHPEYTLIIRDPGLLRRLVLRTDPLLLALDEPAAGMNAAEKVALGELLIRIRDDGKTLLMIEHDVKLVMGICDRLTVLDYGKTLASGTPESVRRDPAVIAAWLGGNAHV